MNPDELEDAALRRAERDILGPHLYPSTAPRTVSELMRVTHPRLHELIDALLDQQFIHPAEATMAKSATEKILLAEAVGRALRRFDAYRQDPDKQVDWTDDADAFRSQSWRHR
jgi:hypothetical protein